MPSQGRDGPDGQPAREEVGEDRLQPVDRHEHVAGDRLIAVHHVGEGERADAEQPAFGREQRRAAPFMVRRRGEDRAVEKVFPIAGERPPGGDDRRLRRLDAAEAGDQHGCLHGRLGGGAERDRLRLDPAHRAHQAEPALAVEPDDRRRRRVAVVGDDLDRHRLGHEIADGDDQPVAVDQHARALALGAEIGRGARVRRDVAPQLDDCVEELRREPRRLVGGGGQRREEEGEEVREGTHCRDSAGTPSTRGV